MSTPLSSQVACQALALDVILNQGLSKGIPFCHSDLFE
jgi:hypothetical protein